MELFISGMPYEMFDVLIGPTSDLEQSTKGALGNGCMTSDSALWCSFLKTQLPIMQLAPHRELPPQAGKKCACIVEAAI